MAAKEQRDNFYTGTAVADGTWIDVYDYAVPWSLDFEGPVAGDTVSVHVSNQKTAPASASHGRTYGAAVAAAGTRAITEPYRWCKIRRIDAGASATITVYVAAHLK